MYTPPTPEGMITIADAIGEITHVPFAAHPTVGIPESSADLVDRFLAHMGMGYDAMHADGVIKQVFAVADETFDWAQSVNKDEHRHMVDRVHDRIWPMPSHAFIAALAAIGWTVDTLDDVRQKVTELNSTEPDDRISALEHGWDSDAARWLLAMIISVSVVVDVLALERD